MIIPLSGTRSLCAELNYSVTVGIVLACAFVVAVIVIVPVVSRYKGWSIAAVYGRRHRDTAQHKLSVEQLAAGSQLLRISSEKLELDFLFGGSSPVVLLLYANDHEIHSRVVSTLALVLRTFGRFNVTFDQWCDSETVQFNGWLHKHMKAADKIVIVASEGACALHRAKCSGKVYSRFSSKYACYHHISDALDRASICPEFRRKLLFVAFPYCSSTCLWTLREAALEQPHYQLPEQMSTFISALHDAAGTCKWSSSDSYESSTELQELKRLIQKMQNKVDQKPDYFFDAFGPAEDVIDSGIDPFGDIGSDRPSRGGNTVAYTVWCSGPDPAGCSWVGKSHVLAQDDGIKECFVTPLRTDMPDTEEIWGTYIEPEPSVTGSLTSEQLRTALQRLNSETRDEIYGDGQSKFSDSSCITVDILASSLLPA